MDDFDFDKLFADKMRGAGAPDLSDEDWEQLTPRLDAVERRRWRVLPVWWLGALSALLLLSNIGWWLMWQQSEKRSDSMQSEWQQIRHESVAMRDTTWSKVLVYQYDTVYQTVVHRSVSGSIVANNGYAFERGNTNLSGTGIKNISSRSLNRDESTVPLASNLDNPIQLDTNALSKGVFPRLQNLSMLPINPVYLKTPLRRLEIPEKVIVLIPQKRAQHPRQYLLIPRKVRIGAGGGFVIPSAAQLSVNSGFVAALMGEIAFSEQLALTLEGAYSGISFTGTEYDKALGLPPFSSPGDDYILKHFETDEGLKPVLQLGAGLRYWLRSTHKLSPYLGLGYAAQWHPEFELKLEYIHQITGEEKEFSLEVPALSSPVSLLDFNAGLRYHFFRRLSLQTGAFYQFKIDVNQPGIPHFWGIKSAVMYEF